MRSLTKKRAKFRSRASRIRSRVSDKTGLRTLELSPISFSQLNSKFSDLQSKVRNQDLMDQLASTRAELQATQKRLEPKPKAILESTFVGEGASSDPQTSKPLGRIGLTVHQRVTDASCGILGSRRCSVVLGSSPLRFKDFP